MNECLMRRKACTMRTAFFCQPHPNEGNPVSGAKLSVANRYAESYSKIKHFLMHHHHHHMIVSLPSWSLVPKANILGMPID